MQLRWGEKDFSSTDSGGEVGKDKGGEDEFSFSKPLKPKTNQNTNRPSKRDDGRRFRKGNENAREASFSDGPRRRRDEGRQNGFRSNDRDSSRSNDRDNFRSNDRDSFRSNDRDSFRSNDRDSFRSNDRDSFRSNDRSERGRFNDRSRPPRFSGRDGVSDNNNNNNGSPFNRRGQGPNSTPPEQKINMRELEAMGYSHLYGISPIVNALSAGKRDFTEDEVLANPEDPDIPEKVRSAPQTPTGWEEGEGNDVP